MLEGFETSYPGLTFPPLPERRGDFDLQKVLESPYFFNWTLQKVLESPGFFIWNLHASLYGSIITFTSNAKSLRNFWNTSSCRRSCDSKKDPSLLSGKGLEGSLLLLECSEHYLAGLRGDKLWSSFTFIINLLGWKFPMKYLMLAISFSQIELAESLSI